MQSHSTELLSLVLTSWVDAHRGPWVHGASTGPASAGSHRHRDDGDDAKVQILRRAGIRSILLRELGPEEAGNRRSGVGQFQSGEWVNFTAAARQRPPPGTGRPPGGIFGLRDRVRFDHCEDFLLTRGLRCEPTPQPASATRLGPAARIPGKVARNGDSPEILSGEETLATAILDRLLHRSHALNFRGRSSRLKELAEQTEEAS